MIGLTGIIGKKISRLEIENGNKAIKITLDDGGHIIGTAFGDCCSESWIEHINLPSLGLPALVIGVEDGGEEELENSAYYLLQSYKLRIITDRGDIDIEYRNESNGYYGGDLIFDSTSDFFKSEYLSPTTVWKEVK